MTIGWIYEDAMERFFEAKAEYAPVAARSAFKCPFCVTETETSRALLDHLHSAHAVTRPVLLIHRREPDRLDDIRQPVDSVDVELLDCERLEMAVDDRHFVVATKKALVESLQSYGARTLRLRLANGVGTHGQSGKEEYCLKVSLPTPAALEAVDREFVAVFGSGAPHVSAIGSFVERVQGLDADKYVEGLAEYVRGVLLKDRDPRSGVTDGVADWSEAYKASLQSLKQVLRPLPSLICDLTRFALNDFSDWRRRTEFPDLDRALKLFGPLSEGAAPKSVRLAVRKGAVAGVCPVDAGVSRVLDLVKRCGGLRRWSAQDDDELRLLTTSNVLNAFDRAKARAVWAVTSLRLSSSEAATEPLQALLGNDCFRAWASAILEGGEFG